MADSLEFAGFSPKAVEFLRNLADNNEKAWFDAHKDEYERLLREPSRAFVNAAAESLKALAPGVHADPRVNRSLFRIHRDQRRVKDGPPFKEHMALWFWEGPGHRMSCSGFYFHLEPGKLILAAGMPWFKGEALHAYRQAAQHPIRGAALAQAVEEVAGRGYGIAGQCYKRLPRGADPEHPNAELLLHGGLYARMETEIPPDIFSPQCLDYCLARWVETLPLHQWLVDLTWRLEPREGGQGPQKRPEGIKKRRSRGH
ncbi:hypothetical protein AAU61_19410 [Desulfocarbo indianensis]|nr:hypothetical protein AAU61_19410 [Desulfocarbo indianensis]